MECLTLVCYSSLTGEQPARELDAIVARRGKPQTVVSDDGTKLTSNVIFIWRERNALDWHYIAPAKPTQNAFVQCLTDICGTNA